MNLFQVSKAPLESGEFVLITWFGEKQRKEMFNTGNMAIYDEANLFRGQNKLTCYKPLLKTNERRKLQI